MAICYLVSQARADRLRGEGPSMGDTDNPSPAVQRRRLRNELRRARQEAGLTQDQVSDGSGNVTCRRSSASKPERSESRPTTSGRCSASTTWTTRTRSTACWHWLERAASGRGRAQYRDVASSRLLQFIELEAACLDHQELSAAHGSRLAADRGNTPGSCWSQLKTEICRSERSHRFPGRSPNESARNCSSGTIRRSCSSSWTKPRLVAWSEEEHVMRRQLDRLMRSWPLGRASLSRCCRSALALTRR